MSDFVRQTVGRFAFPIAALFCAGIVATILVDYAHAGKFGNDFGVYWRTANQPVGMAYRWEGRFPFPYAPTMLIWIVPLGLVPKWPAFFLFGGASIAAFVMAFRPYLPKPAMALTLISPPLVRGICTGQVSALLAALMVWACGTEKRFVAGIAFGVIASIKPQLVLMAPLMFALNRDWKAFASAGAAFLSAVLLSLALFGFDRWPEWLASMNHFHHAVADTKIIHGGVTPAMLAERYGFDPLAFMAIGTMMGAAMVYLCRDEDPLEKTAAITLGSLMSAPYALGYDLAAVVPLLALAVYRGRIFAALALASTLYPLPLIISTAELLRNRIPLWRMRDARQ